MRRARRETIYNQVEVCIFVYNVVYTILMKPKKSEAKGSLRLMYKKARDHSFPFDITLLILEGGWYGD